jgi:predicted peptidase
MPGQARLYSWNQNTERNMKSIIPFVCGLSLFVNPGCSPSADSDDTPATNGTSAAVKLTEIKAMNTEAVAVPVLSPGTHPITIVRSDGTNLRFTLVVPDGYTADQEWPLIVALHFGGEVTPFYGRGVVDALVAPAFVDLDAIIVAPDSIAGPWTNDTNEVAVLQIMDSVLKSYAVNKSQTVLTGFSMGGEGSFYIGGRNQDRFSAVIPVAGRPTSEANWKIPLFAVHSRADTVVPYEPTNNYVRNITSQGGDAQMHTVEDIPHFNTRAFVPALQTAVPWLLAIWKSNP